MKVALDTNVLAYAEGLGDVERQRIALDLVHHLPEQAVVLPVQALGELYNVLTRKAGWSRSDARRATLAWRDSFPIAGTSPVVMLAAEDLAVDHGVSIWDAVILAAATENGCRLLLSEDLQEGFTWRGVTVTNPFRNARHPLLDSLLKTTDTKVGLAQVPQRARGIGLGGPSESTSIVRVDRDSPDRR